MALKPRGKFVFGCYLTMFADFGSMPGLVILVVNEVSA